MPAYPKDGRCPICLKTGYRKVLHTVRRKDGENGGKRETDFYSCIGCSTIFQDPNDFASGRAYWKYEEKQMESKDPPPAESDVPSMAEN